MGRNDFAPNNETNLETEGGAKRTGKTSVAIAEEMGVSYRTIDRYNKLNDLIEPLQEMVDEKTLGVTTAEQIAHFDPEVQQAMYEILGSEA